MKKHLTLTEYAFANGLPIETVVGMVRAGELLVTMVRGRQHVPVDRENRTDATERHPASELKRYYRPKAEQGKETKNA